jgi:hypothetical protein
MHAHHMEPSGMRAVMKLLLPKGCTAKGGLKLALPCVDLLPQPEHRQLVRVDQVKRGALGLADERGNLLHTIENVISEHFRLLQIKNILILLVPRVAAINTKE